MEETHDLGVSQPERGQRITVFAHPRAKQARVVPAMDGTFHIYVTEPPESGRANNAIQKALADYIDLPPSRVQLISGQSYKQKVFEIE